MKSYLFRTSSILALATLLVAFGLTSSTAQQTATRQQQPAQQEEPQLPELRIIQMDAEALRVAVPRSCQGIKPVVDTHDVGDNFNPPGNPVMLSPALTTYLAGKPVKGYDDKRTDMVLADSFKLRSCRVCYATLDFRVQHQPGVFNPTASNYSNDSILAGAAPFATAQRFIGAASIWSQDLPNPKTGSLAITSGGLLNLNNHLFTNTPAFVDVIAQDDTNFDSVTLSVWYY